MIFHIYMIIFIKIIIYPIIKMKLLFWNIQKKDLTNQVAELIGEQHPTIISLAESEGINVSNFLNTLKEQFSLKYKHIENPGCDKINIFCLDEINLDLSYQHKDYSMVKLPFNNGTYLLCFVHLPSKLHQTDEQQRRACERLYNSVLLEEGSHNTDNTIIMGDFNVNPYEPAMISFSGLAASNGIDCSKRNSITSDGESKKLFYNPMWTLYSQYKERPGSHQYTKTGVSVSSWHFLDQVIIRPSLVESFNFNELKFLTKTKTFNHISNIGRPTTSDHLPLVCAFRFL